MRVVAHDDPKQPVCIAAASTLPCAFQQNRPRDLTCAESRRSRCSEVDGRERTEVNIAVGTPTFSLSLPLSLACTLCLSLSFFRFHSSFLSLCLLSSLSISLSVPLSRSFCLSAAPITLQCLQARDGSKVDNAVLTLIISRLIRVLFSSLPSLQE